MSQIINYRIFLSFREKFPEYENLITRWREDRHARNTIKLYFNNGRVAMFTYWNEHRWHMDIYPDDRAYASSLVKGDTDHAKIRKEKRNERQTVCK